MTLNSTVQRAADQVSCDLKGEAAILALKSGTYYADRLGNNFRLVASKGQVSCAMAGESAILRLKDGAFYGLSPVAARIWDLIQTPRTFGEISSILLVEYAVDCSQLEADVFRLVSELANQDLLELESVK